MCRRVEIHVSQCSLRKDIDTHVKRDYLPCMESNQLMPKVWDTVLSTLDSPGNLGVHLLKMMDAGLVRCASCHSTQNNSSARLRSSSAVMHLTNGWLSIVRK